MKTGKVEIMIDSRKIKKILNGITVVLQKYYIPEEDVDKIGELIRSGMVFVKAEGKDD